MTALLASIVGPRIPAEELGRRPFRYALPTALLIVARCALLLSLFLPYWKMKLEAPQYPGGLGITAYVNHLEGDIKEIDGLNHYIGMRPIEQAAALERATSVWLIIAMVLLVEGAAFVHTRWAVLLGLPAILFPAGFLVDLRYWLSTFGQNLDPSAPLSASVKPFTPTVLGDGGIGQFRTCAGMGPGLWLAFGCSILTLAAFYFHRRAYRPLALAARARGAAV